MKKIFLFLMVFLCFSVTKAFCNDIKFVQIDSLMFSGDNLSSVEQLNNFVKEMNKQKNLDFIVFSGDNLAKPTSENLEGFLKITKKLKHPYYIAVGNKEVNKYKKFGKQEYLQILNKKVKTYKKIDSFNYVFIKKDAVFIVLDGAREVIPSSAGYFKPESIDWLDSQLSIFHDKNVVIFQHFPIVPPNHKESRYTFKPEEYLKVLSKHNNVKAIYSGNFNVSKEEKVGEILHVSTPNAPFYRVVDIMNCNNDNSTHWSVIKK